MIVAATMKKRHYIPLTISVVLLAGLAGTVYLSDRDLFVEDADEAKSAVAAEFLAQPDLFDFDSASARPHGGGVWRLRFRS